MPAPFLPAAVQAALDQGNRLEAMRLLRERYGLGLRESMEVIAGIRRLPGAGAMGQEAQAPSLDVHPPHGQAGAPAELGQTVVAALGALLAGKLSPPTPERLAEDLSRAGLAPGEVPRSSGGWVLILVSALIAAYVFFR